MRGFISGEENEHKNDFKRYIKCVVKYQDRDFSSINKIFSVLNDILIDLKFSGKYIIILDQFNFEKITLEDFYNFKSKIPYNKGFKLIICCSLNDDKNKINLFSDYENIELYKFLPEFTNSIPENNKKIIEEKEKIKVDGIHVDDFYLLKKRKRENDKKEELNKLKIIDKKKIKEYNVYINEKNETPIMKISLNQHNYLDLIFQKKLKSLI